MDWKEELALKNLAKDRMMEDIRRNLENANPISPNRMSNPPASIPPQQEALPTPEELENLLLKNRQYLNAPTTQNAPRFQNITNLINSKGIV